MRKVYSFRLFQVQMKVLIILFVTSALAMKSTAGEGVNNGAGNSAAVSPARQEQTASLSTPKSIVHPEVPRIPAPELAQLLKTRADIVIVDTQAPDSYEMWHIPSAINIPYISTANPMDRQLMLRALPMDKLIVIYCLCEEGTDSAKMALELRQLGYNKENIKVLEGGLVLWDEKGRPMIKKISK
jgi:rhodanese-related sulfurtransferase